MKNFRCFLSIFLCLFIFFANTNALCAKAAPLNQPDSRKIASAIDTTAKTQHSGSSNYYDNLKNGKYTFIKSFQISGLDAPQNGHLLDGTATVTADNGYTWEIPVLWVNNDGDLVKVAIEVDESVRSYPVFAFYLPQGYALTFGEKSSYDIKVPDFVNTLFNRTGVATLSNPDRGITYITPLLPGKDRVLVRVPAGYYDEPVSTPGSDGGESEGGMPYNDDPCYPWPDIVDPDTLQYENYNPDFSADEAQDIANRHGSPEAIAAIGADNVAWLVSYIKDVIEPEAVALLTQSFPAYAAAAANNELGKELGVYIYYSDKDEDQAVAYVKATPDNSTGAVKYVLAVNSYYYYNLDEDALKDNPTFNDDSDIKLDTTIIHEMMHALMDDYTRTGMLGMQYVQGGDFYTYNPDADFPEWFVEGIATSVGSPYQYWNSTLKNSYGYDGTSYSNLLDAYLSDEALHLDYSDGLSLNGDSDIRESAYVSGYLANVYLGYLAARKYDGIDAITEYENGDYSINSLVIRSGVNHILEELHNGKTLDDIIFEISDFGDTVLYLDTDDFADKFIANEDDSITDNGISLAFTTKFLNYLESNSIGEYVANGSILTDFTDVTPILLSADLLSNPQTALILTDSQEPVASTVDPKIALKSGGKSETGIVEGEDFDDKLVAFPEKNVAMSTDTTAAPASKSDIKAADTATAATSNEKNLEDNIEKGITANEKNLKSDTESGTVTNEKNLKADTENGTVTNEKNLKADTESGPSGNEKDLKASEENQIVVPVDNQEASSAEKSMIDNNDSKAITSLEESAITANAKEEISKSQSSVDSKEISSIFDAIQTGIDEHKEIAERSANSSDQTTTASAGGVNASGEETALFNGGADPETKTEADQQTSSASSNPSETPSGENESSEIESSSSSDSDALSPEMMADAQSIRNALAEGQIHSLTPEQLAILSEDTSGSDNSSESANKSTAPGEKQNDSSVSADIAQKTSTGNVDGAQDNPATSADLTQGTGQSKADELQYDSTSSADSAQGAEQGKADETQYSPTSSADSAQDAEQSKADETQSGPTSSADPAQASGQDKAVESQNVPTSSEDSTQGRENDKAEEPEENTAASSTATQDTDAGKTDDSQDNTDNSSDAPKDDEAGKADDSQVTEVVTNDKAQDDITNGSETEQENGLTDSGSAVTIDELENAPADISISGPEPEADDTDDNSSDDQQILDALPATDDNDSESDSAADTAPPVE
ncbi:MAG: hypothetical protein K6E91_00440 [Butyrivibrio sp.]|nr:hypothetical protein [Butyrivibrio sp.]